ncbi:MAG TPA: serine hydrolase [Gaiellaceae bacterium]
MIAVACHADVAPVAMAARAALRPPAIVSPARREVSFGFVSGRVSAGTTRVRVFVDSHERAAKDVAGPTSFSFSLDLPPRDVRIRVVAEDGAGGSASKTVGPVYGLPAATKPQATRPATNDGALARRVRRLVQAFPGTSAVYVQDLRTGRGAAWNARARFPAASTLKLAIAVEVLRRLGDRPRPGSALYRDLRSMLVYSNNAAANRLLVRLGGSTGGGASMVNATMHRLGIRDTLMYGGYVIGTSSVRPIPLKVNSQPAFGVGKYTTAWDLARLHRYVFMAARGLGPLPRAGGSFGNKDARFLLWILAHVVDHGKIDRELPADVPVLHKAGWIIHSRHDAGLVAVRDGAFVVAVMTWRPSGVGSSSDVLAGRVARVAFDRFHDLHAAAGSPLASESRLGPY